MPKVTLKLYSILRDVVGSNEIKVDVDTNYTIKELLEKLVEENSRLKSILEALEWNIMIVIDGKPSTLDSIVGNANVIHIMPPPAGGNRIIKVGILNKGETVDFNEIIEELGRSSRRIGAVGLFVGIVRGINQGENVTLLDYEHADEMVNDALEKIAKEEAEKNDLDGVIIYHYTGKLNPGELTIIVAVSGESRKNVYPALESIVERVKHEAPIWKLEHRSGGKKVYILGDKYIEASKLEGAQKYSISKYPG